MITAFDGGPFPRILVPVMINYMLNIIILSYCTTTLTFIVHVSLHKNESERKTSLSEHIQSMKKLLVPDTVTVMKDALQVEVGTKSSYSQIPFTQEVAKILSVLHRGPKFELL